MMGVKTRWPLMERMFKALPEEIPFVRGRHNFSHRLVVLREQYLVPCLNLFDQVGKMSGSNFRCDYHAPNYTPPPVGRREPFSFVTS